MSLNSVFLLHAVTSIAFVPMLLFFPVWLTDMLTDGAPIADTTVVYARLNGLGVLVIGVLPWWGRSLTDPASRRSIAMMLLAVVMLGIALCFTLPTGGGWAIAFWVSLGFYAFFAAAYIWVLFISSRPL